MNEEGSPFSFIKSEAVGIIEYTLSEGFEAEIKDGKVIVRKKESDDERIRSAMIRGFNSMLANQPIGTFAGEFIKDILAYLEKQKEQKSTFDDYLKATPAERRKMSMTEILEKEQQPKMIQWTGKNLKEVIDFVGKSLRFGEWFNSWEEYENYVHTHNDILKLFCENGSHYEVPVGAWIVKTPDGYNVPSVARFIHAKQEQTEVDLEKELDRYLRGEFQQTAGGNFNNYIQVARHFYELGLNARGN